MSSLIKQKANMIAIIVGAASTIRSAAAELSLACHEILPVSYISLILDLAIRNYLHSRGVHQ
jgi:hypothetical protein